MTLEGVLPVMKPANFTSHDVVAKVRGILGIRRIGHTGTLDPQVTGVLPLCIGRATRIVEYIQDLPKEYEAVLTLGVATDTEDMTGNVLIQLPEVKLDHEVVNSVFKQFIGVIEQIPPMYSAIKVDGKRLYDLARQGQEVERKPRKIEIYEMEIKEIKCDLANPQIRFRVKCSKGTYIRTLCVDIGRVLGFPATMSELVRTATGSITIAQCVTLSEVASMQKQGLINTIMIPTDQAIAHMPFLTVTAQESVQALQGKSLQNDSILARTLIHNELVRLYSPEKVFLGLFRWDGQQHIITPEKVFTANVGENHEDH